MPARARESVQRIGKSVDKLGRMINDLLDASRLEARRLTLEREPVSLRAVVEEVTATMPELAAVPLHVHFPEQPPCISADRMRVDQILRNLLSNAAKYGAPGTAVELAVEPRQESFEITVHNCGSGISREDMACLFQRFGRTEASKRAGIPGIGLGLYITKGLVQAHGGRIWAESTPGESTTFHVVLPALAQHAQACAI
jgi:signal transduction histidine kinase